jgi:hypothetical protein
MSKPEQLCSPPIEPIYQQTEPNSIIEFGDVKVVVGSSTDSDGEPTTARANLRFSPKARLEFVLPAADFVEQLKSFATGLVVVCTGNQGTAVFQHRRIDSRPPTIRLIPGRLERIKRYSSAMDAR